VIDAGALASFMIGGEVEGVEEEFGGGFFKAMVLNIPLSRWGL